MRTETSLETRKIIIDLRKEGRSFREISKIVKRNHNTIKKIVDKYEKYGVTENFKRSGRPKRLTERENREIVAEVRKNPRSSAVRIAENITRQKEKVVSASTIRRVLNRSGLHGRVPRKKPNISKRNQEKRLKFAKKYKNFDLGFWETVVFTDECKFEIFATGKRGKVWRKKNKELEPQNITTTAKHGGGSVMVWGCMAASGVGNLAFIDSTMDKKGYMNILKENLAISVKNLGLPRVWVFQQDNDPKHTSYLVREWLLYNTPKQLDHPPQSPDLNPIEHLWDHLDRQIRKRNITSARSLKDALAREWVKIPSSITSKLVKSMPRRLEAVLKAKGKQTRY